MLARILNRDLVTVERLDATPVCGTDFCDTCGDCLFCSGPEENTCRAGWFHTWVIYAEQAEDFRARLKES